MNRIVVVFSPVFVGLAGYLTTLIAKYLPGHPVLNSGELASLFIAGAALAGSHVLLWLHGWQKHEARLPAATGTSTALKPAPIPPMGKEIGT